MDVTARIIGRGVLAGAAGGLLAFGFGRLFAEPEISAAIDYESGREAAQAALDRAAGIPAEAAEPELFSRAVQADVGIGVGMIAYGAALGALFAVGYALCVGRFGPVRARALALAVAGAGFAAFSLVPFLKYPANPPAIGRPDTIQARSALYLLMVACTILFVVLAAWLGRRLTARFDTWTAVLLAGAAFVAATAVVMLVLPPLGHLGGGHAATETPTPLRAPSGRIVYPGFPADVLFRFRLYSVGAQLILWATIGLVFAPLADRLLARRGAATQAPAPVPLDA
jgi:hypothetical protein